MKRLVLFLLTGFTGCGLLTAREFTVLVYNVENLFDLDRVAQFDDYKQAPEGIYGVDQLLGKITNIRRTLEAVNDGDGPEVIVFQEFELDRTPFGTPTAKAFLKQTRGRSLIELLQEEPWVEQLPVELLLLKDLEDHGMSGYQIAQPDTLRMEYHTPHNNIVFSRFPINFVRQRTMLRARDLVVVGLDVDGHELIVLNNHWKSGASNPAIEPVRVQNAHVVRAELESILHWNPRADVLIAGDFNCYYNQSAVFAGEVEASGINDVLPTHGHEALMAGPDAKGLYNLWYEVPVGERGSEVYRGYWGTLMQILLAPGFYDQSGIQYIDNSFGRLMLPGENVGTQWNLPKRWSNLGGGTGFSDHLPVYARFRVVPGDGGDGWLKLENPSDEIMGDSRAKINFARMNRRAVPNVDTLANMDEAQRAHLLGDLFIVDSVLVAEPSVRIRVGDLDLPCYSPHREIREALNAIEDGSRLNTFATLESYRGAFQLVIHDASWIK